MGGFKKKVARLAVVVTMVVGGVVGTASVANAANSWFDGLMAQSTITNCVSIIQGFPYTEKGASVHVGYLTDVQAATPTPALNQTFYVHVVVAGLGNSCAGQRFVPDIWLPAGVSVDLASPAYCITTYGAQQTGTPGCPSLATNLAPSIYGAPGGLMYLSDDTANARTWPLPPGAIWEFQIPVKSTRLMANEMMYTFTKVFDGESNLTLASQVPLYVFGAGTQPPTPPVTINHPAPSTFGCDIVAGAGVPPKFGFCSQTNVMTYNRAGNLTLQIGTTASYGQSVVVPLTANEGWTITTDWDEVGVTPPTTPNTTYHWRACFTPTGGSATCGPDQTFTPPPTTCNGLPVTVALGLGEKPTENADVIAGTAASEVISGLGGSDVICGNGGNDRILPGSGEDTVIGGSGNDTIDFSDTNIPDVTASGVIVDMTAGTSDFNHGVAFDHFSNIENVVGTQYGDIITGNSGNNVIFGAGGGDTIGGGLGNDTIDGGGGDDVLAGDGGTDTVSYSGVPAVKVSLAIAVAQNTGGQGIDRLSTFENLTGGNGSDTLTGSTGNNRIVGGGGNDTIAPGAGNDVVKGGAGVDTLTYAGTAAVKVSLATTAAQNTVGQGTDTISEMENLTGSNGNDTLTGSTGNNLIVGGPGNDVMNGGAGNDTVAYTGATGVKVNLAVTIAQNTVGRGIDTLAGFENLTGSSASDTLTGNAGPNTIIGGAGNDVMNGGAGTDTVSYAGSAAVKVSLAILTAQVTGGAGTDTLAAFERLTGTSYNDVLTGNSGPNLLNGGAGTDKCNGGAGTDSAVSCESMTGIP